MPRPKGAKRNDAPAKINVEILRKAKIVAAYRDTTLAEYLSATLEPIVDRDLASESAKTTTKPRTTKKAGGDKS